MLTAEIVTPPNNSKAAGYLRLFIWFCFHNCIRNYHFSLHVTKNYRLGCWRQAQGKAYSERNFQSQWCWTSCHSYQFPGTKDKSAVDSGRELLSIVNNNLNTLGKLTISDLKKIHGYRYCPCRHYCCCSWAWKKEKAGWSAWHSTNKCSKDVADIFQPLLSDLSHEEFWILFLNRSNKVINRMKLSQGG